ncbi:Alpha/Beta hydrolase protein [Mycena haematopus]|nr:Alpha/Beta hydrolase protein [Mycena haematopus]
MDSAVNHPVQMSKNGEDTVPALPFLKQLKYALIAFAVQNFLIKPFVFFLDCKNYLSPPKIRPDVVKTYACRPRLPIRVFFPRSSKPTANRPALFTIHGGGFVLGESTDNESWNRTFADTHDMIVIALNYTKAPGSPFPRPIHDIEALFVSALADASLPIDHARVALAGWSAGGNLAAAASQLDTVRPRLRALVPIYPALDLGLDVSIKARLRQYKPALGGYRARPDMIVRMAGFFNWCYRPVGHDARDPLLSPLYAPRAALPAHVFVVACELDFLAHEAWRFAAKLAGRVEPRIDEVAGRAEIAGKGELILDDERFHFEAGTYRWLLVPDVVHGFDEARVGRLSRDPVMAEDMGIKTDKVIALIGEWLLAGPLKL